MKYLIAFMFIVVAAAQFYVPPYGGSSWIYPSYDVGDQDYLDIRIPSGEYVDVVLYGSLNHYQGCNRMGNIALNVSGETTIALDNVACIRLTSAADHGFIVEEPVSGNRETIITNAAAQLAPFWVW